MQNPAVDIDRLPPGELMAALIVGHAGGFYVGIQHARRWQDSLVVFTTSFGASLALTLPDFTTQNIRQKLELKHAEFGIPWEPA